MNVCIRKNSEGHFVNSVRAGQGQMMYIVFFRRFAFNASLRDWAGGQESRGGIVFENGAAARRMEAWWGNMGRFVNTWLTNQAYNLTLPAPRLKDMQTQCIP